MIPYKKALFINIDKDDNCIPTIKKIVEPYAVELINDYTIETTDVLFIDSTCNVPRYKLKEHFNITKDPKKATKYIYTNDKNQMYKQFSNLPMYGCDKNTFRKYINNITLITRDHLLSLIDLCETKYVYFENINYINKNKYETIFNIKFNYYYTSEKYIDTAHVLFSNTPLYNQSVLISKLNENSIILDTEKYNEINTLFESKDTSNHVFALQILCNVNLNVNLYNLLLLLCQHRNKIENLKEVNHVNFKSLLNYLNISKDKLYNLNNREFLTNILYEKNQLTHDTITKIKEEEESLFNNDNFKWKFTLELKDEYKHLIQ